MALAQSEPAVVQRLGISWCLIHHEPVAFCCRRAQPPTHNWSGHNALRKYASLMVRGRTHPFRQAGGSLAGVQEGAEQLQQALNAATVQRISLDDLIATGDVQPQHLALVLRGTAPDVRTGNHAFESADHPTVIKAGNHFVVADGHHRLAAAWARGDQKMKARVVDGVTPVFNNANTLLLRPA